MSKLALIPEWVALERAVSILGLGGAFDNQKRANKALAAAGTVLEFILSGEPYTAPAQPEVHDDVARLVPAAAAELQHKRSQTQAQVALATGSSFTIGPNNTYQQAWAAALCGHQIQLPIWSPDQSWVFERIHQELLSVYGDTHESWKRSGTVVCPTGGHQLRTDWIVLPIIDTEPQTV